IKVGDRVGPDLYGVTQRRSTDWLVKFLQAPDKMRREKDPVSMTLVERFPNVRMPNLGLAEADARDMIAYLKAQTDYLDQQKAEAAQRFSSVSHAHHGGGAAPASHGGDGHGGHGEHSPGMPANPSGHKGHDASGGHAMPSGHQADHHAGHHAAPAPAGSQMQPHGAHMHKH
ncbi:MAG: hypothetical protein WBA91_10230, partial [Paracoccaceae bacterium]